MRPSSRLPRDRKPDTSRLGASLRVGAVLMALAAVNGVYTMRSSASVTQSPQLPDRASAVRQCRVALTASHVVVSTFDVIVQASEPAPNLEVEGKALIREPGGVLAPYRYHCRYASAGERGFATVTVEPWPDLAEKR